jgi:hypothetical protein
MFCGKNILTEEKTDCQFYMTITVWEDINFYT